MNDERLRDLYRVAMTRRAAGPGGCQIAPETMVDVLAGKLPDDEHRRTLLAIMSDERCRQEFEILRAVAGVAKPPRAIPWTGWPLRIAASVVLVVGAGLLWQQSRTTVEDVVRQGPEMAAVAVVSPQSGSVPPTTRRFTWRSYAGVIRYEYQLVSRGGRLLYTVTGADTAITVPDSVPMNPGDDLLWWVEGSTAEGRQIRSDLRRLTIISP